MSKYPIETLCARCDKRLHAHFFGDCCVDETPRPDTPRFLSRHIPTEQDAELSALRAEVETIKERLREALDRGNKWESACHDSERRTADMAAALRPFAEYAATRDANPMRGLGDVIHAIHNNAGRAEITLTDCRIARAALAGLGEPDA